MPTLTNINKKKIAMDIGSDILGSLLMGAGIYIFASGSNFATGGVSGIALMLNHLFNIPMGSFSLFMNIPLILISYKILGRSFLLCTLRTLIIQAWVFDYICVRYPVYDSVLLLYCISSLSISAPAALDKVSASIKIVSIVMISSPYHNSHVLPAHHKEHLSDALNHLRK